MDEALPMKASDLPVLKAAENKGQTIKDNEKDVLFELDLDWTNSTKNDIFIYLICDI